MAGFLPGFGRGGITHSLLVIETCAFATGGPGIGEMTDAMDILLTGALAAEGDAAAGLKSGRDVLAGAGWMESLAVVCAVARDEDWA